MVGDQQKSRGRTPSSEPEIIPPGEPLPRTSDYADPYGAHRIYVGRIGPFGLALVILVLAILGVLLFFLVVGAVLLWIPLVGLFVAAAIVSGMLRSRSRRRF